MTTEFRIRRFVTALALAAFFALPGVASADEIQPQGQWLAAITGDQVPSGYAWGRLVVKDGTLRFFDAKKGWQSPLAEITRIEAVKDADRVFEVETITGEVVRFAILGPQMLRESPKRAIQLIERAVRVAPPTERSLVAANAAGSGSVR
jgi:hypothetical protein